MTSRDNLVTKSDRPAIPTCAACHRRFISVGPDLLEPGDDPDDPDLVDVCEDCYQKYAQWKREQIRH